MVLNSLIVIEKEKQGKQLRSKNGSFAIDFTDYKIGYKDDPLDTYLEAFIRAGINYFDSDVVNNNYLHVGGNSSIRDAEWTRKKPSNKMYDALCDEQIILKAIKEYSKEKSKLAYELNADVDWNSLSCLKDLAKKQNSCEDTTSKYFTSSYYTGCNKSIFDNSKPKKKKSRFNKVIITKDFVQHGYSFYKTPKDLQQIDVDFKDREIIFS